MPQKTPQKTKKPQKKTKNIIFIMFDQLRFDYLSCSGHPHLHTPNIDWLASQSVRFDKCYVQSPVCGASRMSFYTGRYISSHGSTWNGIPLKIGEWTMGDHLREADMDALLLGKTHMKVDAEGMQRLGLAPDSIIGARLSECGFDTNLRDDGLWGSGPDGLYDAKASPYNEYLKAAGYDGENPWHDYANAGIDDDGNIASGWIYKNATLPANIREEDSETPWLTREMIKFLREEAPNRTRPWMCHLSYIKPHWPYIVPAPYHDLYGPNSFSPVVRREDELADPNPVYAAFTNNVIGQAFQRDDVRNAALGAYMGLIKQIDDQMGALFDELRNSGQLENTMIVVTSDHGDYMGDHWLGEKDLFHEPSVKVPMIIYDPSPEADGTRGSVCDAFVEAIDLVPTFVEVAGAEPRYEMLEGRSLLPFLQGAPPSDWRSYAISEYDYSMTPMAGRLGVSPKDARLYMVCNARWKFMHAEGGLPPMLFDLEADPDELVDLGRNPAYEEQIQTCYDQLFEWTRRCAQRTTISDQEINDRRGKSRRKGIVLGVSEAGDVDPDLIAKYQGKARQKYI
ncbi:MAG: sulfatase-like hydrolase/transferase [Bacteroidetes bacterium]|nr:sulfatase-like hydrolase/transferase [Bacteroidota bacterium]